MCVFFWGEGGSLAAHPHPSRAPAPALPPPPRLPALQEVELADLLALNSLTESSPLYIGMRMRLVGSSALAADCRCPCHRPLDPCPQPAPFPAILQPPWTDACPDSLAGQTPCRNHTVQARTGEMAHG